MPFFLRQLIRRALLYTEMVTTGALLHGKGDYFAYNDAEHPLALQLGGSKPDALARCAKGACIAAMHEAVSLPITVKTRIGIDEQDSYAFLCEFIDTGATHGGCQTFIIHARKAWLNGLSPKKNREILPLNHDRCIT